MHVSCAWMIFVCSFVCPVGIGVSLPVFFCMSVYMCVCSHIFIYVVASSTQKDSAIGSKVASSWQCQQA